MSYISPIAEMNYDVLEIVGNEISRPGLRILITGIKYSDFDSVHVITPTSKTSKSSPDKLNPSLSCWIKNMNKLSSLIDRLHELASAAPAEHRSQLLRQVVALRAMFKRQQERFIEFLQLSEEFADKYLLDISAEVQQQSNVLNNLEERLEAAKTLHKEAIDLQMFYESGTVATMKDLCVSGKAVHCCLQRQNTQNFYFTVQ